MRHNTGMPSKVRGNIRRMKMTVFAKTNELKEIAAAAENAYDAKRLELVAFGMKSAERYIALKDLRAQADAAAKTYRDSAYKVIKSELNKIIRADAPAKAAAARQRSAWKMAKYNMAQSITAN